MAVPDEVLSRVGEAKNLDGLSDDDLKAVLKEYYDRCVQWGQKLSKKAKKNPRTLFCSISLLRAKDLKASTWRGFEDINGRLLICFDTKQKS